MKHWSLITTIAVAALAAVLFLRDRVARAELLSVKERNAALARELSTISEKYQHQRKAGLDSLSESGRYKEAAAAFSNQWAQATAQMAKAEAALKTAETQTKAIEQQVAELKGIRDDLVRRNGELETTFSVQKEEISELERKLKAAEHDRGEHARQLAETKARVFDLEQQLQDPAGLQVQLTRLKQRAAKPRPINASAPVAVTVQGGDQLAPSPSRAGYFKALPKLTLLPDGSVTLVTPTSGKTTK